MKLWKQYQQQKSKFTKPKTENPCKSSDASRTQKSNSLESQPKDENTLDLENFSQPSFMNKKYNKHRQPIESSSTKSTKNVAPKPKAKPWKIKASLKLNLEAIQLWKQNQYTELKYTNLKKKIFANHQMVQKLRKAIHWSLCLKMKSL